VPAAHAVHATTIVTHRKGPAPEGHTWILIPKDMVPEVEALLARRPSPLPDDAPLSALELSARSAHALASVSVETVGDLCSWTAEQLRATPGLGPGCLKEVEGALAAHGLALLGGAK